jgi:hypothetical protein
VAGKHQCEDVSQCERGAGVGSIDASRRTSESPHASTPLARARRRVMANNNENKQNENQQNKNQQNKQNENKQNENKQNRNNENQRR